MVRKVIDMNVYIMPKFRKYTDGQKQFYMSRDRVQELAVEERKDFVPRVDYGKPDYIHIGNRFWINRIFNSLPKSMGEVRLPTLREYFIAKEDPEFEMLTEFLIHFLLSPNASTETENYVLRDSDGKSLGKSNTLRVLNPTKMFEEGGKEIIVANIFDVPFKLDGNRRFNDIEDLDSESGFLKRAERGRYSICYRDREILSASIITLDGIDCDLDPTSFTLGGGFFRSHAAFFRGVFSGGDKNQIPMCFFENEEETKSSQREAVRKRIIEQLSDTERRYQTNLDSYKSELKKYEEQKIALEARLNKI